MRKIHNETTLQYHINDDIRKYNIPFDHRKSSPGGKYHTPNTFEIDGVKMKWPDLKIYMPNGRTVFIELKWIYGKPDKEQQAFLDWAMKKGYPVYTCKSVDEWELIKKIEFYQIAGLEEL